MSSDMYGDESRVMSSTPRPAAHVVTSEMDGELVVFDPVTDSIHLLDPVATVVWSRLDGEVSVWMLSAELARDFNAREEQVRSDVATLVAGFGASGLLDGVAGVVPKSIGVAEVAGRSRSEC